MSAKNIKRLKQDTIGGNKNNTRFKKDKITEWMLTDSVKWKLHETWWQELEAPEGITKAVELLYI